MLMCRDLEIDIPVLQLKKIVDVFGPESERKIKENPYCMITAGKVSFSDADDVAAALEFPKDSPYRLNAAITAVLIDNDSISIRCALNHYSYFFPEYIEDILGLFMSCFCANWMVKQAVLSYIVDHWDTVVDAFDFVSLQKSAVTHLPGADAILPLREK